MNKPFAKEMNKDQSPILIYVIFYAFDSYMTVSNINAMSLFVHSKIGKF